MATNKHYLFSVLSSRRVQGGGHFCFGGNSQDVVLIRDQEKKSGGLRSRKSFSPQNAYLNHTHIILLSYTGSCNCSLTTCTHQKQKINWKKITFFMNKRSNVAWVEVTTYCKLSYICNRIVNVVLQFLCRRGHWPPSPVNQ